MIDANKTLDGFATANISDFGSFKRTDGYVSNAQTNNNIRLAQNKREGRAARADAKYSGKPGGGKP